MYRKIHGQYSPAVRDLLGGANRNEGRIHQQRQCVFLPEAVDDVLVVKEEYLSVVQSHGCQRQAPDAEGNTHYLAARKQAKRRISMQFSPGNQVHGLEAQRGRGQVHLPQAPAFGGVAGEAGVGRGHCDSLLATKKTHHLRNVKKVRLVYSRF